MGQSENEIFQSGQSSTQDPRTYTIRMGNKLIRLIDTPGIGDARGVEVDMQNIAKISEYLSAYKELHGICILSKATHTRLTPFFKFCLNELLTQLNKSAIENFVFCFTFASRDGLDTNPQELLKEYFHQLQTDRSVCIKVNKENTYFLENKAFRFLCAYHSGVTTSIDSIDVINNYRKCWKSAVEETYNLFEHVSQLKPHNLQGTISLNASRQMILALKQPILSIFLNLEMNIEHFGKLKKMINESKDVSKIVMEKIETEYVNLEHGKMKCFSEYCNGKVCHEICDATNGYNQSLEEYIDTEIQVEMASSDIRGEKNYRLKRLNELKNKLKNEGDLLEQAMEQEASYEDTEIFYLKGKLLLLPMSGKYIEKAYENIVKQKLLFAQKHETVFDAKINGLIEEFAKNVILEMKERRPDKKMDSFVQEMDKKQVIQQDIKENRHKLTKVSNVKSSEELKLEQNPKPEDPSDISRVPQMEKLFTKQAPIEQVSIGRIEESDAPISRNDEQEIVAHSEQVNTVETSVNEPEEEITKSKPQQSTKKPPVPSRKLKNLKVSRTQVRVLPTEETMDSLLRKQNINPVLKTFKRNLEQNQNASIDETIDP
uniref:AIG1-type G domain-containing protein n=1 Tax=Acrobeloides nanus TaxID=290746 RepID=A0A914DF36_9BILA